MHIYLFFSQSNAGEALIDDLITTKRSLLSFSYSCFGKEAIFHFPIHGQLICHPFVF